MWIPAEKELEDLNLYWSTSNTGNLMQTLPSIFRQADCCFYLFRHIFNLKSLQ